MAPGLPPGAELASASFLFALWLGFFLDGVKPTKRMTPHQKSGDIQIRGMVYITPEKHRRVVRESVEAMAQVVESRALTPEVQHGSQRRDG